jgi:hypothetical protein
MKIQGNPTLEKYALMHAYSNGEITGKDIGAQLLAIDEKHRPRSEKVFRFVGQLLFGPCFNL